MAANGVFMQETGVTPRYCFSSISWISINYSDGSLTHKRIILSFSSFLMIQLINTADLQEGILLGCRKRGSEGAALTERCRKQRNGVFSGNIWFCLITLRTDRSHQIRHLPGVFAPQAEELSRTGSTCPGCQSHHPVARRKS